MKNKVLFTLLMLAGLSCIAQNSHKKFKIETSTVIEEMKQSMDGDYSDVFSSVWNSNSITIHRQVSCFSCTTSKEKAILIASWI